MNTKFLWAAVVVALLLGAYSVVRPPRQTGGTAVSAEEPLIRETTLQKIMKTKTIRCGYATWPPAVDKDPNTGKLSGINYEFMEAIAREMDLKVEWAEEVGYGNAIQALKAGRFDMMCSSFWPDVYQTIFIETTIPTYYSAVYAYVRANDNRFDNNFDAMNQPNVRIIGIEGDSTYGSAVRTFDKAQKLSLPQSSDAAQLMISVVSNKADVVVIDSPLVDNFLKHNPSTLKRVPDLGAMRVYGEMYALPKGETHLKRLLDETITTLINSGTMDRILSHYDGTFIAPAKTFDPVPIVGKSGR